MKLIIRNKNTVISQKVLSEYDKYRFNLYLIKNGKEDIYSSEKLQLIFKFFYNIDIGDYGIDRVFWQTEGEITVIIKEEDLVKIRDAKINQILD